MVGVFQISRPLQRLIPLEISDDTINNVDEHEINCDETNDARPKRTVALTGELVKRIADMK